MTASPGSLRGVLVDCGLQLLGGQLLWDIGRQWLLLLQGCIRTDTLTGSFAHHKLVKLHYYIEAISPDNTWPQKQE